MKRKAETAVPVQPVTLIEIQRRGLDALARELGPDGLIRFFQLYGLGEGDYTHDRDTWLSGAAVDDIAAKIGLKKTIA